MIWQTEPHDVINQLRERKNGDNFTVREWELHATKVDLQKTLMEGYKALITAAASLSIAPDSNPSI